MQLSCELKIPILVVVQSNRGGVKEDVNATPDRILKNVRKAVDDFVEEAEQFDDLTMLCLEYKGRDD